MLCGCTGLQYGVVQCCVAWCMDTHRMRTQDTGCGHRRGRGRVLRGDPAGAVVRLFTMLVDVVDMLLDIVDMFGFVLRHELLSTNRRKHPFYIHEIYIKPCVSVG